MNRRAIALIFVSLYAHNTLPVISQNAKEGEKLKEQIGTKKNTTVINKNDIMYKYRKEFDAIFNRYNLNTQQKNHAYELQCNCSRDMEKLLGEQFVKSEFEAENAIAEQRALCLAKAAKMMAAYHYEIYIAKKGQKYNEATQQKLEDEAYNKTFKEAQKEYWRADVRYLVNGEFEKELEKKIDASLPKEIYEVYPQGPRQPETLNNISNGKHYRSSKCCVCLESFEDLGKRVNLPCGHDICLDCLEENLHQHKRRECPQCKKSVTETDFPANYLKEQKAKKS